MTVREKQWEKTLIPKNMIEDLSVIFNGKLDELLQSTRPAATKLWLFEELFTMSAKSLCK